MFDSNRLLIAAAAIALIACALIWGVIGIGLLTRNPDRAAEQSRGEYQFESYDSAMSLTEQACLEGSAAPASDPQSGNKRELCAQYLAATAARGAANHAEAQTWIGVFGFAFVVVGLILNWVATLAATEAAQQTKRSVTALMDTERAWMLFDDATLEAHLEPAKTLVGPHPLARITIRNVGKGVAWMRRVQCRIVKLKRGETLPAEPEYGSSIYDFDARVAILPGKPFFTATEMLLDWDEADLEAFSWGRTRIVVYGLVEYADAFGRLHITQFARSWKLTQFYGTLGERDATAFWSPTGLNPYNYHT